MLRFRALGLLATSFVLLSSAGCGSDDGMADAGESDTGGSEGDTGDGEAYTWWRDVEPVVRQKCAGCHAPGNTAPFSLETHEEFVAWAALAGGAIESGVMPPWGPIQAATATRTRAR